MNSVLVLAVIWAGFIASPALAQVGCIPKELNESVEALQKSGLEEQKAANEKLKFTESTFQKATDATRRVAQAAVWAAAENFKLAQMKVKTQLTHVELVRRFTVCPTASDSKAAASSVLPDAIPNATVTTPAADLVALPALHSVAKWNQLLLIFLIFLVMTAVVILCFALRKIVKGISEADDKQKERFVKIVNLYQSRATAEPGASTKMRPSAGKATPAPPSRDPCNSSLNKAYSEPAQDTMKPVSPESQVNHDGQDDVDAELNEQEIWPILLPIAGNLVESYPNLDSASLTPKLWEEIKRVRPGLVPRLREIEFKTISGRVSPDGREITRDPEMFAIELSGRTLLFPSPRGGYRPAFDAYFERANVASWNRCLQPALMQKVGDNLLSVIARGICG